MPDVAKAHAPHRCPADDPHEDSPASDRRRPRKPDAEGETGQPDEREHLGHPADPIPANVVVSHQPLDAFAVVRKRLLPGCGTASALRANRLASISALPAAAPACW